MTREGPIVRLNRMQQDAEMNFEVSAISGHKELRMLQRYTHLRAAELVKRLDLSDTRS